MKKALTFIFILFIVSSVFSQTDRIETTKSQIIDSPVPDAGISEIVKNIKNARVTNDAAAQVYWEKKLHELTKPQVINSTPQEFHAKKEMTESENPLEALNMTRVTNSIIIANSVSRERVNGDIYAAIAVWGGETNTDTLRIYRSTNNGISFTLLISFYEGMKIMFNGLDVEAMSNGDSSYAFVSMDFTITGTFYSSAIVRVRQDGNMFNVRGLFGSPSGNNYGKGRITSDNGRYTSNAYLYYSLTLDSLSPGGRFLRSKMYRLESPFSVDMPVTACFQSPLNGTYAYYVAPSAPDTAKFESDIAYVNSTGDSDQVYTVSVVRGVPSAFTGGTTIYFSRTNDYGNTAPTLFSAPDGNFLKESPRIAATGYFSNNITVVTRRLLGGGNWQPYYFYSSGINASLPSFSMGQIDNTTDTTIGVSVTARYRTSGTYLFAYNKKINQNGNIFGRPLTAGSLGAAYTASPTSLGTTYYGNPDAAFRNVNNDSCLIIWGGPGGVSSYVTGGCGGTFTSIGSQNSIPEGYALMQNYPNPFNPSTIISYQIPVNGFVSIKVFDVLGKEVAVILNQIQSSGKHEVEFNGMNLSSGVYYYRIEANDFIDTKKMILVK